jgi:hypothetical protein
MKRHPHKRDIFDTALKISDEPRRSAVQAHLSRCRPCRERYDLITALLSSSDNRAIAPSEKLYLRIIGSLNEIEKVEKSVPDEQISPASRLLKTAVVIAASALVIITAVLAIRYSETYSPESLPIAFEKIRGTVHINNDIAHPISVIGEGSMLRTDNRAIAAIAYRDFIKIVLSGNTTLKIKKAEYNEEKEVFRLAFDLTEGTVYSSFSHRGVKIDYSFNTPKAIIHAIGTEFLLSTSGNKTILILTRGSVYIKSTVSGEEVKSTEGNEYIITSSIEERKIDAEGMKAIQSIKDYMKMKKSLKKIKSIKRSVSEADHHADKSDLEKTEDISEDKALRERKEPTREKRLERRKSREDVIDNRREFQRMRKDLKSFKR